MTPTPHLVAPGMMESLILGPLQVKNPSLVSTWKHRMRHSQFPIWKGDIFRPGQEIKGLRGGVHRYAAQVSPKIDTARTEKDPFRTETS